MSAKITGLFVAGCAVVILWAMSGAGAQAQTMAEYGKTVGSSGGFSKRFEPSARFDAADRFPNRPERPHSYGTRKWQTDRFPQAGSQKAGSSAARWRPDRLPSVGTRTAGGEPSGRSVDRFSAEDRFSAGRR